MEPFNLWSFYPITLSWGECGAYQVSSGSRLMYLGLKTRCDTPHSLVAREKFHDPVVPLYISLAKVNLAVLTGVFQNLHGSAHEKCFS